MPVVGSLCGFSLHLYGLTTISLLQLVPSAFSNVLAWSIISGRSQGLSRKLISVFLGTQGQDNESLSHFLLWHFKNLDTSCSHLRSCFWGRCDPFLCWDRFPTLLAHSWFTPGSLAASLSSYCSINSSFLSPGTPLPRLWSLNPINRVCLDFLLLQRNSLSQFCYEPSTPNFSFSSSPDRVSFKETGLTSFFNSFATQIPF